MTTIEDHLAAAQRQVDRRKCDYERARDQYRHAVKVRDNLDALAAENAEQSNRENPLLRGYQTITEEPAPAPTLDSDPRHPDDQAHEFFTRPGDFYQVALALPVPTTGADIGARFMVKADDTQLPYLLEVLRQLRGALGAASGCRIELTKAQITPPDGPPMEIGKDFTLGDRFPPMPVSTSNPDGPIGTMPRYTEVFAPPEPSLAEQIAEIAERQGVKPEQIQVIPVRGGGYAYTVKPQPQPERGRHARPDAAWENSPAPQHLAADDDHDDADIEGRGCCGTPYTGEHQPDCVGDPNYQYD
ncbi:hypothetical protein [Mycobacteroides chelonae]|uniref:hypothetical protein n=1 Tax=Mycobacteroides chelonae TaxID=1774 RepID=UPI0008A9B573|nr:hypothetical protein [Mycobacteroides chelonae]OHU48120.1 hypothetical protein BKG81_11300 [Mycobacteroides chelonae]